MTSEKQRIESHKECINNDDQAIVFQCRMSNPFGPRLFLEATTEQVFKTIIHDLHQIISRSCPGWNISSNRFSPD
jgi:hypothetical protein